MALFYCMALFAIICAGWFLVQLALFPIYKLFGGGDNFRMYVQYIFTGVKTW